MDTAAVAEIIDVFERINTEVPERTRTSLTELQRLDESVQKRLKDVQKTKLQFMANYEKMTEEQRCKAFILLQDEMEKISKICDEKVEIAKTLRNDVHEVHSKFIIEQAKFIECHVMSDTEEDVENAPEQTEQEEGELPAAAATSSPIVPEGAEKKRGRKKKETAVEVKQEVNENDAEEEEQQKNRGDNEDEKKYCWCKLEKQDSMVACENTACVYEWFHFTCMGIKDAPTGEWYCTHECRDAAAAVKKESKGREVTIGGTKRGPKKRK